MKNNFKDQLAPDIVTFRKNSSETGIFDVSLNHLDRLKNFRSIELHFALYPYSRKISSRDISFYPFEEDLKDISTHLKSVYTELKSPMNVIFGVGLGLIIALFFQLFKPESLYSVESIVAIFGAYAIGKEMWGDVENGIVRLSKNWRIRYQKSYYLYQLERSSRLTKYSALAKKHRYGKISLSPAYFDFLQQSNSMTLRMRFDCDDLSSLDDNSAHIFSCHIDEPYLSEFSGEGYMLGAKFSVNSKGFFQPRAWRFFSR